MGSRLCRVDFSLGGARSGPIAEVALQIADVFAFTVGANTLPIDDDPYGAVSVNVGMRIGAQAIHWFFDALD